MSALFLAAAVLFGVHHGYSQPQATNVKCEQAICTVYDHNVPYAVAVTDNGVIDHLYPIVGNK